ncbi:hypothetical protein Bhyg_07109 [Pseudolycoriella hygida]|uniref:Uncharacterized protein n=1 Tax=Pseudolycoriella hygida TaxID=35572 RepID=A0A9Q0S1P2_9DIPT|nr:hypothetical protein Bhyg_07109 [Pseudolycoriella hygida]
MAGYRPMPPSSPMLSHQNNRGPIYHHPMNNHGIVYPSHTMNGPINMHGQHNTHHHHLMTRHHMAQQPRQMLHHGGITMTPKVMPLNAKMQLAAAIFGLVPNRYSDENPPPNF